MFLIRGVLQLKISKDNLVAMKMTIRLASGTCNVTQTFVVLAMLYI